MGDWSAWMHRALGLLHPQRELALGASGRPPIAERDESGLRLSGVTRAGPQQLEEVLREGVHLTLDELVLEQGTLAGTVALSRLRGSTIQHLKVAPGSRMIACDAEGSVWEGLDLRELSLESCSLTELRCTRTQLGQLQLCDLRSSQLEAVQLQRAWACDFSDSVLTRCDFSGADLRSSSFRDSTWTRCVLQGARVEGADFRGARGLDDATRAYLIEAGAMLRGLSWYPLIQRLRPGASPREQDRLAVWISRSLWGLATLTSALAAIWVWTPPDPVDSSEPPPALPREVTVEERRRSQMELKRMREDLERAHQRMLEGGAVSRAWPTMTELQDNRFDLDGEGPGEAFDRIFPEGFPENFLTEAEGSVLPYCNEEPSQETISGVDTDWHYCEQTGRVFASAGFSGEATLNW